MTMRSKKEFTDYYARVKEYYDLEYCEYEIYWDNEVIESTVFEAWDNGINIQECSAAIRDIVSGH